MALVLFRSQCLEFVVDFNIRGRSFLARAVGHDSYHTTIMQAAALIDPAAAAGSGPVSHRDAVGHSAKVLRSVLRHIRGGHSGIPTPAFVRFQDVGLLYFMNQKQVLLHELLSSPEIRDLAAAAAAVESGPPQSRNIAPSVVDALPSPAVQLRGHLQSLAELLSFVVGGLILEAERIDEAVIATQQEILSTGTEMYAAYQDVQMQRNFVGDVVTQTLNQFYKSQVLIPTHTGGRIDQLRPQDLAHMQGLPERFTESRRRHFAAKSNLRLLRAVQRMMHGVGREVPDVEAEVIASELDVLSTARRASHRIRDLIFDMGSSSSSSTGGSAVPPASSQLPSSDAAPLGTQQRKASRSTTPRGPQHQQKPSPSSSPPSNVALPPSIISLQEFLGYVDCSFSALAADLDNAMVAVDKHIAISRNVARLEALAAADRRNKTLSMEAVRLNETYTKRLPIAPQQPQSRPLRGAVDAALATNNTTTLPTSSSMRYTPAGLASPSASTAPRHAAPQAVSPGPSYSAVPVAAGRPSLAGIQQQRQRSVDPHSVLFLGPYPSSAADHRSDRDSTARSDNLEDFLSQYCA